MKWCKNAVELSHYFAEKLVPTGGVAVDEMCIRDSFKVVEFLQRYGFIILIVLLASGVLTNIMTIVENWILNGFFSFWALFI